MGPVILYLHIPLSRHRDRTFNLAFVDPEVELDILPELQNIQSMTGFEPLPMIMGYAGAKALDALLARLGTKTLWSKLEKETEYWAEELPEVLALASAKATLASTAQTVELDARPATKALHQKISEKLPVSEDDWLSALVEQWHWVHGLGEGYAPFFRAEFETVQPYLADLSVRLRRICHDDPIIFRRNITEFADRASSNHDEVLQKLDSLQNQRDILPGDSRDVLDPQIEDKIEDFKALRTMAMFDAISKAQTLSRQIVDRVFAQASPDMRARGIGWCIRILSQEPTRAEAIELLQFAEQLPPCEEIEIGRALLNHAAGSSKLLRQLDEIGTPLSYSAALISLLNSSDKETSAKWLHSSRAEFRDLEPVAQIGFLNALITSDAWDEASRWALQLEEAQWSLSPVLSYVCALIRIAQTVRAKERPGLIGGVPFEPEHFDLAQDEDAQNQIASALEMLDTAELGYRKAGFEISASECKALTIWLHLKRGYQRKSQITALQELIEDEETGHVFADLALRFCPSIEPEQIADLIERYEARFQELDFHTAKAKVSVILASEDLSKTANEIARARPKLQPFLSHFALANFEFSALCKSGRLKEAKALYSGLEDCPEFLQQRFERMLSEAEGGDPVEARRIAYEKTKQPSDLDLLIDALWEQGASSALADRLLEQFDLTKTTKSARRYISVLEELDDLSAIAAFLDNHQSVVLQDQQLAERYAYSLYQRAKFSDLFAHLQRYRAEHDSEAYRDMYVAGLLATGRWSNLADFAQSELDHREQRSAFELIKAGQLISHKSPELARRLLRAGAEAASDDARVLAAAYQTSINIGDDKNPLVQAWFEKAIELSDEKEGPFFKADLKDLVDRQPDWREHEENVWGKLQRGEIMTAVAADGLNRTLVSMLTVRAVQNRKTPDLRKWGGIPIHHGGRKIKMEDSFERLSMDLTSILVLADLNALDLLFEIAETLIIPHGTLALLHSNVQRASFHQPAQIEEANEVLRAIQRRTVLEVSEDSAPEIWLTREVGFELANLIAACADDREAGIDAFVVHPGTVRKVGSFEDRSADLRSHGERIIGCQPLIRLLRDSGRLAFDVHAMSAQDLHLRGDQDLHEELELSNTATLYLDGLALAYLIRLNLLEPLKDIGLTLMIDQMEREDAERLIEFESNADQVLDILHRVETFLAKGIASGTIHIAPQTGKGGPIRQSSTLFASTAAHRMSDALLCDDRCLNTHGLVGEEDSFVPLISSIDFLTYLCARQRITSEEMLKNEHRLRTGGYVFVPITPDVLERAFSKARYKDGHLIETAELRSIRSYLDFVKISDWFEFEKEDRWLADIFASIRQFIIADWASSKDLTKTEARSTWLANLVDWRDWLRFRQFDPGEVSAARAEQLWALATLHFQLPPEHRRRFMAWVDQTMIEPTRTGAPDVFAELISMARDAAMRPSSEGYSDAD